MFGRNRRRLAETERVGIIHAGFGAARFGLVGDQNNLLARTPHEIGEGYVGRRDAGLGVDKEEDEISFADGKFRLGTHAAFERFAVNLLEPCRIDDIELQIVKLGAMDAAIAGDAGKVVDERDLAADEPVEQRGLTDIRTADYCDGKAHGIPVLQPAAAAGVAPVLFKRSSMVSANWRTLAGAA